jgi:hypothetical protein
MCSASEANEPLIVLPGPWPGHPHPFKHLRVYGPNIYNDCSTCPKSMLCLAGRKLFKDEELQGDPHKPGGRKYTRYSICAHCSALLWFEPWQERGIHEDTMHICYWLGLGLWERRIVAMDPSTIFGKESLARILAAGIGKVDPDLVPRFFRRDNLCGQYKRIVGDCARLYHRFLRQRAYLPDEIREKGWVEQI